MSALKECMIVNVHTGMWVGHKVDKVKSREVTQAAGAESDAARVNKHLVPKEALAKCQSAASAIRSHFYTTTLPWKDNGDRLLTRRSYMAWVEKHEELAYAFNREADIFLNQTYLVARERAEFRMGTLFKDSDYPRVERLRKKFYVHVDIDGVSDAKDIRLNDNSNAMQERVTRAMEGLWNKLAKPLAHFAEKMTDEKAPVYDTTIENLRAVATMIPDLNFTGDAKLEELRLLIEKEILPYETKDLRGEKNAATRVALGTKAKEIMDGMAGFMTSMGQSLGGDDE